VSEWTFTGTLEDGKRVEARCLVLGDGDVYSGNLVI
jgi:hypothetical protein